MRTLRLPQRSRCPLAWLAAPLVMILMAACGSSQGDKSVTWTPAQVPIGGGKTITVQGPPHIAYFPAGGQNNYLAVRNQEVYAAVKKIPGATVATFDANWVGSKQRDMIQNAIASGKYNAFIADTDDGNAECNQLTKDAPAANIAVVTISTPICGLYLKPDGRDETADGTIGGVGNNNINSIHDYLLYMIKQNPGPQKVLVVTGPPLHPLSPQMDAAVELIKQEHPEFEILANVKTNFSTLDGYHKTAPLLVAHPDTTVIFSGYADTTTGVIAAVKSAGLLGKIKIYDQVGNRSIVEDIRQGWVAATTGGYPAGSANAAVGMIQSAFEGKPFARTVLGDGGPVPADEAHWSGVTIIDKSNLNAFRPEY
jgi:ribose transport system substrate-binding protein